MPGTRGPGCRGSRFEVPSVKISGSRGREGLRGWDLEPEPGTLNPGPGPGTPERTGTWNTEPAPGTRDLEPRTNNWSKPQTAVRGELSTGGVFVVNRVSLIMSVMLTNTTAGVATPTPIQGSRFRIPGSGCGFTVPGFKVRRSACSLELTGARRSVPGLAGHRSRQLHAARRPLRFTSRRALVRSSGGPRSGCWLRSQIPVPAACFESGFRGSACGFRKFRGGVSVRGARVQGGSQRFLFWRRPLDARSSLLAARRLRY